MKSTLNYLHLTFVQCEHKHHFNGHFSRRTWIRYLPFDFPCRFIPAYAFPVAAVRIWNSLPQHVTSAPSLPVFCTRLKTYFFELCLLFIMLLLCLRSDIVILDRLIVFSYLLTCASSWYMAKLFIAACPIVCEHDINTE